MSWRQDKQKEFRINSDIVKNYFTEKADLVFTDETARIEEEALLKYIDLNKPFRVLDLGCGNGRWGNILKDNLESYVGVDFSETFINDAKKKFNEDKFSFYCMPADDFILKSKFDLILIIGLITYLNDDQIKMLAGNVKAMLSDGGKVILRNVSLGKGESERKVYDRKISLLERILGRKKYQIIRRSVEEELNFFNEFNLVHKDFIQNTNYVFYIFEK